MKFTARFKKMGLVCLLVAGILATPFSLLMAAEESKAPAAAPEEKPTGDFTVAGFEPSMSGEGMN